MSVIMHERERTKERAALAIKVNSQNYLIDCVMSTSNSNKPDNSCGKVQILPRPKYKYYLKINMFKH